MAYLGFLVKFADGRELRESDVRWDEVPDEGIASLSMWDDWERPLAILDGAPGRRFYFYNEAAAGRGGMGFLVAKGIGYVEGDRAVEIRIDTLPGPNLKVVRGAIRDLGAAVNGHMEAEACLPLERLRARGEELPKKVAELRAKVKSLEGSGNPAAVGALNDAREELGQAVRSLRRVDLELEVCDRRAEEEADDEAQVQVARRRLAEALDGAVEALNSTDRDVTVSWRSFPASEYRLGERALRRAG
jgi:hypothetical protein